MKKEKIVVVTPHPDDETLGCGGTLLSMKDKGHEINWLIVTGIFEVHGFSKERINSRRLEIDKVASLYGFSNVIELNIPTTKVDELPKGDLVMRLSTAISELEPTILLLPFINDVHTDHQLIAEASISCTKWFRYPSIEKVLYYETLSETDFNIDSTKQGFTPNVYVDITDYLDKKIEIMSVYESEMGVAPFPRSERIIRSLAYLRGSQCGKDSAESFQLLRATIV